MISGSGLARYTSYACVILAGIDCVILNIPNLILQFFKRHVKNLQSICSRLNGCHGYFIICLI